MISNKAYLKRAWKHILSNALLAHKGRAAIVFFTGLITTLIQMLAVLLIIGAARAYDNSGILEYGGHSLDLREGSGTSRIGYISLTVGLLILSILAGVGNKLIITNIGRKFFEETLTQMRKRVMLMVKAGESFNRSDILQILNRDCRYVSLSYLRVLTLLQPALFLIVLFAIAVFFVPIAALFLGLAGCIVFPLNIYLVFWAAKTSQDIQSSAKIKSAEEKDFMAKVSTHPFIHHLPDDFVLSEDRPGETGFLDAFVKRQRMGAYSQSITDIMMALVIITLAVFLFMGGGNTLLLNLSNLVILVILFRFMTGYISQSAQTVTMVSSYEPFFRTLLNLEDHTSNEALSKTEHIKLEQPLRLAVFQSQNTDWSNTAIIRNNFGISEDLQYITNSYDITREHLKDWKDAGHLNLDKLSQEHKAKVLTFLNGANIELEPDTKLLLALSIYTPSSGAGLLLNGKELVSLTREDMRLVLSVAESMPLIIVYKHAPRNLILPPRFQLAISGETRTKIIGNMPDFQKLRSSIVEELSSLNEVKKATIELDSFGLE